jgi:hypothetical protein
MALAADPIFESRNGLTSITHTGIAFAFEYALCFVSSFKWLLNVCMDRMLNEVRYVHKAE